MQHLVDYNRNYKEVGSEPTYIFDLAKICFSRLVLKISSNNEAILNSTLLNQHPTQIVTTAKFKDKIQIHFFFNLLRVLLGVAVVIA